MTGIFKGHCTLVSMRGKDTVLLVLNHDTLRVPYNIFGANFTKISLNSLEIEIQEETFIQQFNTAV